MDTGKKTSFYDLYFDDGVDLNVRLLRLVGFYSMVAVALSVPCFFIAQYDKTAYIAALISIILLTGNFGVFYYSKDVVVSSVLFCYLMNIVIMPMYFLFAGGIYGGFILIFVCGIVDALILLKDTTRTVSIIVFTAWYLLIVIYSLYHGQIVHNIPEGSMVILSMGVCVVFSSVVFLIVTDYDGYLLEAKKKNVGEAVKESILSAETKSRFLSNVSHELRTPMNAIIGMSGIIQNSDTDGQLTEEISIITHNARDLLSTINSILDYSRLESGKLALSFDQFELDMMLKELLGEASIRAEEKGIDIFVDIAPDSPNVLYGDHIQLEMILQDLLSDAIDSVTDGRVHFRMSGRYSKDRSRARFVVEISDTGSGISEEDLNTIYSSFETYDSRQDSRIKRLGLKYSVFKGILELMNGDFEIRSLRDVGTTVIVTFEVFTVERIVLADKTFTAGRRVFLYAYGEKGFSYIEEAFKLFGVILDTAFTPDVFAKMYKSTVYDYIFISEDGYPDVGDLLEESDREKVFIITDRMGTPADFDNLRIVRRPVTTLNLSDIFFERWDDMDYSGVISPEGFLAPDARILVVDDNMVNLKVAESLLDRFMVSTRICDSGFKAMEFLKTESFDLVLMDQVMPGMDGFETMKLIRSSLVIRGARRIPIVCMTADSGSEIREKVMHSGFNDYLQKPVKESELERILTSFLPEDKIRVNKEDLG